MVLEATMLVLDNSEWMRNGDYTPTRWEAQADAVSMIFDAKTNSNPESEVGLMTMAGKSPEVLVTLTQDIGKILAALHRSKIVGNSDLTTGINVASLALKHRQNKNQRQRVVVFVGSPVEQTEEDLVKLGKKLKKNNIAVDIISFGEDVENEEKLSKFIEAVNSGDNSHLLSIPAGPQLLSDIILSSPVLQEEGGDSGAGPSGSGGGGNNFEFGVDPSMDPELAMALRLSLEEEQARQRAAEGSSGSQVPSLPTVSEGAENITAATGSAGPAAGLAGSGSMVPKGAESITGEGHNADDESEEAMLQKAIALSQAGEAKTNDEDVDMTSAEPSGGRRAVVAGQVEGEEDEEMDEDEAIARAIQMSLQEGDGQDESK
ncbi:putative 26S proteasome regulatory subunit Rpn10 [Mycosarcoma maydis]|uniref:26S proteasome regulatory subunit Rpn10 n=1 Tax=Mycosarcoma maydis TaxID=5270 RepID=A0A0D1E6A4_MYCMD|nr:putative 26S proteasome regulatory subunit Rpn10 [Ustilago maydis 521]KIS69910.1 putative 26S proteasome regulatory subunit Rpn10 [Ustilago maydis 521]|eukprot:XP_011388834.1 putative 26S proteasome regulatory subunit Rpn10 [Ustilago maydis 521]